MLPRWKTRQREKVNRERIEKRANVKDNVLFLELMMFSGAKRYKFATPATHE